MDVRRWCVCVCSYFCVFVSVVCFTSALGLFLLLLSLLLPFSLASKKKEWSYREHHRHQHSDHTRHSEWMKSLYYGEKKESLWGYCLGRQEDNCCKSRSIQQRNARLYTHTRIIHPPALHSDASVCVAPIEKWIFGSFRAVSRAWL